MGDIIVSIILFIVSFGILISIHEAGHLAMAKLFKVYCKEYSIGFGPALFSRKKEGHETKFSIRAIPFGGYVSMFGEGMEDDPDFKDIPQERSLEGIKKWKKAIVLSAGVILNALLAFVFIFISNVAFPTVYYTSSASVAKDAPIAAFNINNGDNLQFIYPESYKDEDGVSAFSYEFTDDEKVIHANNFFIVDDSVTIGGSNYCLTFFYTGNKKEPVFTDGIMMYEQVSKDKIAEELKYDCQLKKDFIEWAKSENCPEFLPNFEKGVKDFEAEISFVPELKFEDKTTKEIKTATPEIKITYTKKGNKITNNFSSIGLSFQRGKVWLPFGQRLKYTFQDYGSASIAVFKGLKTLFTGGIKNMSGIVGIFDASASLYANYTFATYLFFWGLISVNLAIFNLLPFPGLDGWQLLVTAIEGITRKKIPMKAKSIMSLIGLILLFALMIVIVVLDILRIAGV